MYFQRCAEPLSWRHEQACAGIAEVFAEAHAVTRQHGIRLVVAFIPAKYRVYRDVVEMHPGAECLGWAQKEPTPDRLRALLAEVSPAIGWIDLTPALRAAAAERRLVYLFDDTHWSADGHRVAAEAINRFLQERP